MTPLRQKMVDAMLMHGYSPRTQSSYIGAVRDLTRYHRCSPDQLSLADVERWLLHLVKERQLSPSTCHLYFSGVRFLFVEVLAHPEFEHHGFVLPQRKQRIPELLTRREVALILDAPDNLKHRLLLRVCYACGLRLSELIHLRPGDIDGERFLLHVVQGKGGKDRLVPLPEKLLEELRLYWQITHPAEWLFPSRTPHQPLSSTTPQKVFSKAKQQAGVQRHGGIHSLRHAFATHQLQSGAPIHQLQKLLGHRSISATLRYSHWLPETGAGGARQDLLAQLPETAPETAPWAGGDA